MTTETFIQDGNYPAKLKGAQTRLTAVGKLMLVFLWEFEDGRQIKSYSVISQPDGTLNPKPIGYIQRWCPDWDGVDPYWFEENLAALAQLKVRLSIRNEQSYRDPTISEAKVMWINPLTWGPSYAKATEGKGVGAGEPVDPEALMTTLARDGEIDLSIVRPTMSEVWGAYAHLCREVPIAKRNACWITAMKRLVPSKDQIDFDEGDWECVLEWVRGK